MGWMQPQCCKCYDEENPGRRVHAIKPEFARQETCCTCGKTTNTGIFVRKNPATVKFPSQY